jgi:hypothetical protein
VESSADGKDVTLMHYFCWKLKGKQLFGRLRRRSEDNIKMDVNKTGDVEM